MQFFFLDEICTLIYDTEEAGNRSCRLSVVGSLRSIFFFFFDLVMNERTLASCGVYTLVNYLAFLRSRLLRLFAFLPVEIRHEVHTVS